MTTGKKTYFGQLSGKMTGERSMTSFDKGINQYTWLMIKFIFIMAPLVFLINGLTKGNWFESFLFGIAVAVGLTPEMLPIQVLTNNLLYDISQTTIPTDSVDEEWIARPRKWAVDEIKRFILYIGPISSIFDYATYFLMLYVFKAWNNPALFQTGWFVESLFTQTLIIHVIRTNRIPFIQSRASRPLMVTSILIVCFGAFLANSTFGSAFGFVELPSMYWVFLILILFFYVALTQVIKMWYIKKYGVQ